MLILLEPTMFPPCHQVLQHTEDCKLHIELLPMNPHSLPLFDLGSVQSLDSHLLDTTPTAFGVCGQSVAFKPATPDKLQSATACFARCYSPGHSSSVAFHIARSLAVYISSSAHKWL